MKTKKIISWKKHPHECGFRVITETGESLFIEDYNSSFIIETNDDLDDIIIEQIEFGKDYQYGTPEEERDPNKLDYSHVDKCKIMGSTYKIQSLLYSIGWSNYNKYHVYKEPIIDDLKDEISRLKNSMEELVELLKKNNSVEA